jgi:hypothetical protein
MRWSHIAIVLPWFLFTTSTTAYPVSTTEEGALSFVCYRPNLPRDRTFNFFQERTISSSKHAKSNCDRLQGQLKSDGFLRAAGRSDCQEARQKHDPNSFDWSEVKQLSEVKLQQMPAFFQRNPNFNLQTAGRLVGNDKVNGVCSFHLN